MMNENTDLYAKNALKRRTGVSLKTEKDLEQFFKVKAVKDGDVYVVRYQGRELRNPTRKEALRDLATILNYELT